MPIFVLTHQPPEEPDEGLDFTFVTDGVESAIRQVIAAAGEKDVTVIGGAETGHQLLRAGLVDELSVDIAPILLGEGLRLFEKFETAPIRLEWTEVTQLPMRTMLKFRVVKAGGQHNT